MITKEIIKELIEGGIPGAEAHVKGDDGQHFEAAVIATAFEGQNTVKQHQMVYATLGDRVHSGEIHALALKTYTPTEWAGQQ